MGNEVGTGGEWLCALGEEKVEEGRPHMLESFLADTYSYITSALSGESSKFSPVQVTGSGDFYLCSDGEVTWSGE